MIKIYRFTVIFSFLLFTTYMVKPYIDTSFHDYETLKLMEWNNYGALIIFPGWFDWLFLGLWAVIAIGMVIYNKFARITYLVLVLIFTLGNPFFGLFISTGTDLVLYQLVALFDGAVLTMAYFTSVSNNFKKA